VVSESREIGGEAYVTAYAWDLADNLVGIVYPSGRIVTYGRNSLGRVDEVRTKADAGATEYTVASGIAYEPFGPLAGLVYGNGLEASLAHDGDYRLTDLDVADGVTAGRSRTFVYDDLARLVEAEGAYGPIAYAYDEVGNRTSRTVMVGRAVRSFRSATPRRWPWRRRRRSWRRRPRCPSR
jgi:YD repeat-containing protein